LAAKVLAELLPERSRAESDGYVVDAIVKAMGDECMDVMGYGHHGCDGLVEVQLGHWLAIAGVYSKLRGLVREEPDGVGTGRQRNPSDRVLALLSSCAQNIAARFTVVQPASRSAALSRC